MNGDTKSNEAIVRELQELLGREQVLHKLIDREARAGDASIYRMVPRVVVLPRHEADVAALLEYCRREGLYLTFRAAGTSLSGQAVTDGILVDVATHWRRIRVLEDGKLVAVQPGVIGARVNEVLLPYQRKIGPDPASINACMIGGIAANNASGMCCDVARNTYHTMKSMRFMLADGFVVDTSDPCADERLARERAHIYGGITDIRREILERPALAERIRQKFSIKNTCGYSLNAFVDYEQPVDILSHLLVGSEGTLGFISEITYETIAEFAAKATALVFFARFVDAHRSVKLLADAGAAVLEIMDSAAMRSVEHDMKYGFEIAPQMGALLIEFQEPDAEILQERVSEAQKILGQFQLLRPASFTTDAAERERYWRMRKGLFPSVGAMRQLGTAVIIEDVCVRPEQLADCVLDLQEIFAEQGFADTIIFGHAKAGNLHFVVCTDFADAEQRARYATLLEKVARLIVDKYDGSLKGEHGTGRNMAPFVELEWGSELYQLMWRVKRLLDPDNILNPGVVLNSDPQIHLRALKAMPAVSPTVDKCIECGYCESKCPSRSLTLTPRQRIAILRRIELARRVGSGTEAEELARELEASYRYHGLATCATDGLCATACPVGIDTGELVKELRARHHSRLARAVARWCARHFRYPASAARLGLGLVHFGGKPARASASALTAWLHRVSGGAAPQLPSHIPLPRPAGRIPVGRPARIGQESLVYLPSCLTRSMGRLPGECAPLALADATLAVLRACGYEPFIAPGVENYCCGQPFVSKGYPEAAREAAERMVDFLWDVSVGGSIPIVCDTSPCSGTIISTYGKLLGGEHYKRWQRLRVYDFPDFVAKKILPQRHDWPKVTGTAVLHPTCTLTKLGGRGSLERVARTFCECVIVPAEAGCCGFAGDRGFLVPELTASATRNEAEEIAATIERAPRPLRFYSTSRTCEMGLSAATGQIYQSIVYLCYEALIGKAMPSGLGAAHCGVGQI